MVFAGVQSLDVTGPMDVFSEANRFLAPQDHYRLEVIGVERGVMACSNGLALNAHRHFSEALAPYDLLLVAGGPQLPFMDFGMAFDGWLRDACARATRFGLDLQRRVHARSGGTPQQFRLNFAAMV